MPGDEEAGHGRLANGHTEKYYSSNASLLSGEATQKTIAFLADTFTPDFFRRTKPHRIGSTAWLDGLRGWAAFGVCFMHLTVYSHSGMELCYNQEIPGDALGRRNNSPLALPILRLPFVGGHFSVMLFFVISGYVVPRRLLQLLLEGKGRSPEVLESIQSAMVRRPVRLFVPVILSTLLLWNVWHIFGIYTSFPAKADTWLSELVKWAREIVLFVFFFRQGFLFTNYNAHTWTIPVELRGSMLILVWLYVMHTVKTRNRLLLTTGIWAQFLAAGGAWYAAFFAGMIMSELELMKSMTNLPSEPTDSDAIARLWDSWNELERRYKNLRWLGLHVLFVCALYLASQPSNDFGTFENTLQNCPGWMTLSKFIPWSYTDGMEGFRWWWLFWAAVSALYCIREIEWLRRLFEAPFSQYLGRHSFALYLIHGPTLAIVSERLFYLTGFKTPDSPEHAEHFGPYVNGWRDREWWPFKGPNEAYHQGLEPNFWVCVTISIPIFLYVAEIGTRLFDGPSVKASRWVWGKLKLM
ncbi:hypothetical protein EJ03DRAFT_327963 [Teratosphaeria nubilosa]|uniref:Acyltransferase 3 domain-containing protein n=1 Tax=Teratosphaeria nubilosa TaxID=161662 RepID=A0A6G1L868_9PEZI|nr:hypothetical protein EJ03DRAFT_327963 [Teratosphaeria nubilosa]